MTRPAVTATFLIVGRRRGFGPLGGARDLLRPDPRRRLRWRLDRAARHPRARRRPLVRPAAIQLPTIAINVPLNNELQAIDLNSADETTLTEARSRFEARWNQSNVLRTILAILTSGLWIILVLRR